MPAWRSDLAYVHDQGYGFHATDAAPAMLELTARIGDSFDDPAHPLPVGLKSIIGQALPITA